MIDKILENNINEFDGKLVEYSLQIKILNHLRKNNDIEDKLYKKIKSKIEKNYSN